MCGKMRKGDFMRKIIFLVSSIIWNVLFFVFIVFDYFPTVKMNMPMGILRVILYSAVFIAFLFRPRNGLYKNKKMEFIFNLVYFGFFVFLSITLSFFGGSSSSGVGLNNIVVVGLMGNILWDLFKEYKKEKSLRS